MMKEALENWQEERYCKDKIRAIDAKYEAQKIAFAPFSFQAILVLRKLGILESLLDAGDEGLTLQQLMDKHHLGSYQLKVLLEMALSMDVVKWKKDSSPKAFVLGKIGFFLETDKLTIANMDFAQDVCYQGMFKLMESIQNGKPEGLKVFGDWKTIYEGLSQLPQDVQHSWFQFDHFYSDGAFPQALKFVFSNSHKRLMDIGGNTAKWALACANFNDEVNVTIVDLPGQAKMATEKIKAAGFSDRINVYEANMLSPTSSLPGDHDAVWMSQFLDCFSLSEITAILEKVFKAVDENAEIFVMEPLWDKQNYPAASYSLHATSLYFTAMANGNSKMYGYRELCDAIEAGGFQLADEIHQLGPNDYSILKFKKRPVNV
ncbi:MAG: methyltransferase [Spirochaetales bacterium]|nr:methyltransferase [Spirochaetales bacterium]